MRGQYNRQKKPTENIGLPDSLLSRFDLLFIVLDQMKPVHDREISMHVLRMHQYRKPGEEDGAVGAVVVRACWARGRRGTQQGGGGTQFDALTRPTLTRVTVR